MALNIKAPKTNREIFELIDRSIANFNSLSPEQKRKHRKSQRRSWVIGELMFEHPEMSRAEAERICDRVENLTAPIEVMKP